MTHLPKASYLSKDLLDTEVRRARRKHQAERPIMHYFPGNGRSAYKIGEGPALFPCGADYVYQNATKLPKKVTCEECKWHVKSLWADLGDTVDGSYPPDCPDDSDMMKPDGMWAWGDLA